MSKAEKPLTIKCERCFIEIGQGHTYGCLFYCEYCMQAIKRAERLSADWDDLETD